MKIGDVELQVSSSPSPQISQYFSLIQTPTPEEESNEGGTVDRKVKMGHLSLLGECRERFVCTPDVESLLK